MGFAESLATLAMDPHERDKYYELANSSDPADRQAARQKINGGKITPLDLVKTYGQVRLSAKMEFAKEQYSDMKQMIQNLTKDNPIYDSINPAMQERIKAIYAKDTPEKKEKSVQELLTEISDKLSSVLPQDYEQHGGIDGPEMG